MGAILASALTVVVIASMATTPSVSAAASKKVVLSQSVDKGWRPAPAPRMKPAKGLREPRPKDWPPLPGKPALRNFQGVECQYGVFRDTRGTAYCR